MPKRKIILLSIFILTAIIVLIAGSKANIKIENVQDTIKSLGILAPVLFIAVYAVSPMFFVPIIPLSITGGILFGPILGTVYSVIGATIGGCLAFLAGRYLMKDFIDKKLSFKNTFMKQRSESDGWRFVIIARITPIFPFGAQNYLFGVTNISLRTFFWASFIGLLPGTFAYVYLGYAGINILEGDNKSFYFIIAAFVVLAIITLFPYIFRKRVTQVDKAI